MNTEIDIYAGYPEITLQYQIAVMQAAERGACIEVRSRSGSGTGILSWTRCGAPVWDWLAYQYRVDPACKPQPAPKPKKCVPLDASDFTQPVIWLRHTNAIHCLVTSVDQHGVFLQMGSSMRVYYDALLNAGYKYSTDRKTWLPCYKEVEQ